VRRFPGVFSDIRQLILAGWLRLGFPGIHFAQHLEFEIIDAATVGDGYRMPRLFGLPMNDSAERKDTRPCVLIDVLNYKFLCIDIVDTWLKAGIVRLYNEGTIR